MAAPIKADPVPLPPLDAEGAPEAEARAAADGKSAELRFLRPEALGVTVELKHPFEWEGKLYESIRVRRLSVAQIGELTERVRDGKVEMMDFYAAAMGLPVEVLRAMPEDDGGALMEAAHPFLPRVAQALVEVLTHDFGDDTP